MWKFLLAFLLPAGAVLAQELYVERVRGRRKIHQGQLGDVAAAGGQVVAALHEDRLRYVALGLQDVGGRRDAREDVSRFELGELL